MMLTDKQSYCKPFWLVWNLAEHTHHYHIAYSIRQEAIAEADRLAATYPGNTFIVLESVCAIGTQSLHRTDLRPVGEP